MRGNEGTTMRWVMTALSAATLAACGGSGPSNELPKGIKEISRIKWDPHTTGGVIAMAAAQAADQLDASLMVAFTVSGDTARRMSRLRSETPLVVLTPDAKTAHWLTLCWGAQVYITPSYVRHEDMVTAANQILLERGLVKVGERVVIVAGSPMGLAGKTNLLRVHRIQAHDWTEEQAAAEVE